MKRILIITMFLLTILTIRTFSQEEPVFKKCDMISGYVEYKVSGTAKGKAEFFFEEYGLYSSVLEDLNVDTLNKTAQFKNVEISTPDSVYSIDLLKATGTKSALPDKSKAKELFEIEKGDFEKVKTQLMKDDGYIKVGNENILDKDCTIWELNANGSTTKIWVWKGIELKILMKSDEYELSQVAIRFVEEEPIPFSKFEPPSGVKWEVTK
ncbi:MAG: hypothetical protein WCR42_13020 [bacterium]